MSFSCAADGDLFPSIYVGRVGGGGPESFFICRWVRVRPVGTTYTMRRPLSWFFASVGEVEKNVKTRILRPAVRMLLIGVGAISIALGGIER